MGLFARLKQWLFGASPPIAAGQPVALPSDPPIKIGISGGSGDSKSVAAMVTMIKAIGRDKIVPVVMVDHAERIRRHGGVEQAVAASLEGLSALVVMGNDRDIPPESYGEKAHPKTKSMTVNDDGSPSVDGVARRTFEKLAMMQAVDADMPLLGVCAGMQGFNVDGGGTLHQYVPDIVGDHHHMQSDSKIPPFVPVQFVKIEQGSQLAKIVGSTPGLYTPQHGGLPPSVIAENSMHNQAVKDARADCVVTARSEDGIIEAMEMKPDASHPNRFAQFVQFHPEFGASDLGPKLAASLTNAARAYAQTKPAQQEPSISELLAAAEPGKMAAMVLQRRQNEVMHR